MPGTRYEDWHHLRVEGDQAAARDLIPLSRKVLGYVAQQARYNGLLTYKHVLPLPDGGEIVGEVNGGIPRVTIHVPPPVPERARLAPPEDFVVWARNEDFPGGLDTDHPQQILKPPGGNNDDGANVWTTYFFNPGIEGFDAFDGRKSIYQPVFPNGLRRAGNLDWRGPNRERIQWYGPSTRYWYDPFVQMVAQYGTKVFMAGQVVLDTPQYIADSAPDPGFDEQYVLGAGLRGRWLYVVQVQAQNLNAPPPDPVDVTPPGNPYYLFGPSYTPFAINTVVARYRLAPHPDGSPGYRVVARSREVVWSGPVVRGIAPWFFNPDCSEAVTFLPPEVQGYGSNTFVPNFDAATTRKVLTLLHSDDDSDVPGATMTDTAISLPPGEGEAPIAADYAEDGTRIEILIRRRDLGLPNNALGYLSQRFDLIVGGAAVELRALERETGTEHYYDTRRWVMWADAREGVLVTRRQFVHFRDPPGSGDPFVSMEVWLEVWQAGTLVLSRTDGRTDISDDNNSFGTYIAYSSNPSDRESANLQQALAPLLPLYGWCWGSTGALTPHIIAGAHAGFCYLPRQPGVMFGYTLIGRVTSEGVDVPSVVNIYADRVNAPPAAAKIDNDGMDGVLGAAASEGILLLSAYPKGAGLKAADHVVVPGGPQLPELTGVPPPLERYHPIWLLGRPPPSIPL